LAVSSARAEVSAARVETVTVVPPTPPVVLSIMINVSCCLDNVHEEGLPALGSVTDTGLVTGAGTAFESRNGDRELDQHGENRKRRCELHVE
jgi:hypothetical protein